MEKNVKFFNSKRDYRNFLSNQIKREINSGSEGIVYLTKDNHAIKENFFISSCYPNDNILMESDIKLKSFIFPQELYVVGKDIIGYKTEYFPSILRLFDGDINDIDINAFINASYQMIDDVKVLSKMKYILYDLPNNLLFNGRELKAIDTLQYYKKDYITTDENLDLLKEALIQAYCNHDSYCPIYNSDNFTRVLEKEFKRYL